MLSALHIETPLIESTALSRAAGRAVWLKVESVQPSGSFKLRGVGLACQRHAERGARRFVSSSGGNAGLAVAYAGRRLGLPVVVVVPESTTDRARALLANEGAAVVTHGASWHEANSMALSMVSPDDAFIHPFDDAWLWEGHSTLVDEVARSGLEPDAVVLSVGGGGLLCGIAAGMQRAGWGSVPIVAVETRGTASLDAALRAASRVQLAAIEGIATSLGARQICEQAWQIAQARPVRNAVVSDRSALQACERFSDDHRLVVEPACGASLALAYEGAPHLDGFGSVLMVVCGGATCTMSQIRAWSAAAVDASVD